MILGGVEFGRRAILNILTRINRRIKRKTNSMFEQVFRSCVGYIPYYNRELDIYPEEPEIYNRNGERMRVFFISDAGAAHDPYFISYRDMNYIMWDRYNFGLRTHFYTAHTMFRTVAKPDRKFAVQSEPRAIQPANYDRILREKSYIENEFEALFTHSEELLSAVKNAKFYPACSSYWYSKCDRSVKIIPDNYKHKKRGISILASGKAMCDLHKFRQAAAVKCVKERLADAYGTFTMCVGGGGGYL